MRSTRNVRQSLRSRSYATRYQRRSVATRRYGSARRRRDRPSRELWLKETSSWASQPCARRARLSTGTASVGAMSGSVVARSAFTWRCNRGGRSRSTLARVARVALRCLVAPRSPRRRGARRPPWLRPRRGAVVACRRPPPTGNRRLRLASSRPSSPRPRTFSMSRRTVRTSTLSRSASSGPVQDGLRCRSASRRKKPGGSVRHGPILLPVEDRNCPQCRGGLSHDQPLGPGKPDEGATRGRRAQFGGPTAHPPVSPGATASGRPMAGHAAWPRSVVPRPASASGGRQAGCPSGRRLCESRTSRHRRAQGPMPWQAWGVTFSFRRRRAQRLRPDGGVVRGPHIKQWWREEHHAGASRGALWAGIDGHEPTELFIVEGDGVAGGLRAALPDR